MIVIFNGCFSKPPRRPAKKHAAYFGTRRFPNPSLAALPFAVSLAEEYQSKLTLLQVIEQSKTSEASQSAQLNEPSERNLLDLIPEGAKFWCAPHALVEQGAPGEKILEVAIRVGADLIVLGVHKPEGVPSSPHRYGSSCRRSCEMSRLDRSTLSGNYQTRK